MRPLIRLYPRAWRRRYGEEYAALLDELPPRPGIVIDVLRAAADAHLSPPDTLHGGDMHAPASFRRSPLLDRVTAAVAALALVTPVVFLVSQVFPRGGAQFAVLADLDRFFQHPVGEALIMLGPVIAFAAGALATIGLRVQTHGSEKVAVVAIRVRAAHLALMALSAVLLAAFAVYLIAENL